jgi:hypothetical protein
MTVQKLPKSGPAREALREKGQFWTPDWVAEAMVGYVLAGGCNYVFDPAVGEGAFFRAAKAIAKDMGKSVTLLGTEVDPNMLFRARLNGLSDSDLEQVRITDFVLKPPDGPFEAIVANPPYIRHHRLPDRLKSELKAFGIGLIHRGVDGRAGIHVYFLLRALQLLGKGGRLAFIVPADTCEGIFAPALWNWVTQNYRLEAVVTFTPEASPFPEVDINPIILMIRNTGPVDHFFWVKCARARTKQLKAWTFSGFDGAPGDDFLVYRRTLAEGLATGLSRSPREINHDDQTLGDFASVLRGIATGSNEFFFLTTRRASALKIPGEFLIPAIGRTRDVTGDELNFEMLAKLDARGRPTMLFSPDDRSLEDFPSSVRDYLKHGEAIGLDERPLIATRRPWYKMEARVPPPILFTYLGRRNARFILNLAKVAPLTGFLCIYPRQDTPDFIDKLWRVLRHPATIANLSLVGKSYGSGAIKVEPRALERLPLPASVISEVGLKSSARVEQLGFLDTHVL